MTHVGYVAASYALGVLVPVGYALAAWLRVGAASRRLAAIDPRGRPRADAGADPGAGLRARRGGAR